MLRKDYSIAGVYCIRQRGKGVHTKKLIGCTANIERTFRQAKIDLARGNFHNHKLQQDYNKGVTFIFEVWHAYPYDRHAHGYQSGTPRSLAQYYIEKYDTMNEKNGYNTIPLSGCVRRPAEGEEK